MLYLIEPNKFNPKFESVGCFIENNQEILLLHRQNSKPYGNAWGIPSGKIDSGETPLEAMVREIKEETAFEIPKKDIKFAAKTFVSYPDFDFIYHIFHTCLNERKKVKLNPDEHTEYRWVSPNKAFDLNLIPDQDTCIRLVYVV